jgi:hypothetical protein
VVEVPYAPDLDGPNLTVEAWIRVESYPTGWDPRRWAVCKAGNEWADTNYSLVIDGANVGAYLNIGGGQDNSHEAVSTSSPLPLRSWVAIAFTYDGGTLRVYCDGREVAAKAIGKQRTVGPAPISLGGRQDGYSAFDGDVDEVRVYSRALSGEELRRNREALRNGTGQPPAVVAEGLAAQWGFEDVHSQEGALQRISAAAGLEDAYRDLLEKH